MTDHRLDRRDVLTDGGHDEGRNQNRETRNQQGVDDRSQLRRGQPQSGQPRRGQPRQGQSQGRQPQDGSAQQSTRRGTRGPQGPPSQQRGHPPNAGGGGDLLERLPLKAALVIGVAVFFVGIGLQVAVLGVELSLDEDGSASDLFDVLDDEGPHEQLSDWAGLYYNGHFAELETEQGGETESFDIYSEADSEEMELPSIAFRLPPIIVLIGGGYVLASRTQRRVGERPDPIVAGASIVVGYGLVAVLGIVLFSYSVTGAFGSEAQIAPAAGDAILLPGLIYPLLFGAIGGFLAGR